MTNEPRIPKEVVVCMGSSCFPRGNNHALEMLMTQIKEAHLSDRIQVSGTLCQNRCKQGPNVTIDGECFCGMDSHALSHLVDQWVGKGGGA
jgi:NADH:ubiquinone oxidoreductase subunit E